MGRPKGSKNKVKCSHDLPFNLDEDIKLKFLRGLK